MSPTNIETSRADTIHAVINAVVFENPTVFGKCHVTLSTTEQSLVSVTILCISCHGKEAAIELALGTVEAKHKVVNSSLSAVLERLIESIVKTAVRTQKTNSQTTEAFIVTAGLITPTATFVKSQNHKYTVKRANVEERWR